MSVFEEDEFDKRWLNHTDKEDKHRKAIKRYKAQRAHHKAEAEKQAVREKRVKDAENTGIAKGAGGVAAVTGVIAAVSRLLKRSGKGKVAGEALEKAAEVATKQSDEAAPVATKAAATSKAAEAKPVTPTDVSKPKETPKASPKVVVKPKDDMEAAGFNEKATPAKSTASKDTPTKETPEPAKTEAKAPEVTQSNAEANLNNELNRLRNEYAGATPARKTQITKRRNKLKKEMEAKAASPTAKSEAAAEKSVAEAEVAVENAAASKPRSVRNIRKDLNDAKAANDKEKGAALVAEYRAKAAANKSAGKGNVSELSKEIEEWIGGTPAATSTKSTASKATETTTTAANASTSKPRAVSPIRKELNDALATNNKGKGRKLVAEYEARAAANEAAGKGKVTPISKNVREWLGLPSEPAKKANAAVKPPAATTTTTTSSTPEVVEVIENGKPVKVLANTKNSTPAQSGALSDNKDVAKRQVSDAMAERYGVDAESYRRATNRDFRDASGYQGLRSSTEMSAAVIGLVKGIVKAGEMPEKEGARIIAVFQRKAKNGRGVPKTYEQAQAMLEQLEKAGKIDELDPNTVKQLSDHVTKYAKAAHQGKKNPVSYARRLLDQLEGGERDIENLLPGGAKRAQDREHLKGLGIDPDVEMTTEALERAIKKLKDSGMHPTAIARELGVDKAKIEANINLDDEYKLYQSMSGQVKGAQKKHINRYLTARNLNKDTWWAEKETGVKPVPTGRGTDAHRRKAKNSQQMRDDIADPSKPLRSKQHIDKMREIRTSAGMDAEARKATEEAVPPSRDVIKSLDPSDRPFMQRLIKSGDHPDYDVSGRRRSSRSASVKADERKQERAYQRMREEENAAMAQAQANRQVGDEAIPSDEELRAIQEMESGGGLGGLGAAGVLGGAGLTGILAALQRRQQEQQQRGPF